MAGRMNGFGSTRMRATCRLLGFAFYCGLMGMISLAAASEITWKETGFTKTTFEEDVKVILREIVKRNGMEVFFRPGVEGQVTFEFANMPLQAAFNKVMEENGFTYTYEPTTHTVTVFKSQLQTSIDEVFVPEFSELSDILSALERFGVLNSSVRIEADKATNSLFLRGDQAAINPLKDLLAKIDKAYKVRKEKDLETWRHQVEKQGVEQEQVNAHVEVRVIPLRYASVNSSSTSFQGKSIALPGIIDSLKAFVGSEAIQDSSDGKKGSTESKEKMAKLGPSREEKPIVTIDQRTNSVIVQGTTAQVERIQAVIMQLDKPVPLVEIEVMIVDGKANLSEQLGIRWGVDGNVGSGASSLAPASSVVSSGTTTPLKLSAASAESSKTNNAGIVQLTSTTGGLGAGFLYQGSRFLLDATLNALTSENKLHTIASPKVVTLDNLAAKITSSNNVNFIVTTGDGTKSDIKTVGTGVTLSITPSVIPPRGVGQKRMVRLEINAMNSSIGSVSTASVTTNEQQMQTNVIIPENATFVMGGLFSSNRTENESGVPGLRSVPLLGRLFRNNDALEEKRETVFFITPKVYASDAVAGNLGGEQIQDYVQTKKDELGVEQEAIRTDSKLLNIGSKLEEDE